MKNLNVLTVGTGKKLVFCTSGMFAGAWMWDGFLNSIDTTYYKFFVMEDAICEISNNVEEVAKAVEDYLTLNNLSDIVIMGNSLGGLVSLILAQTRPDLIAQTIISGTPHTLINLGIGMPRRNNREWVYQLVNKVLCKRNKIEEATEQILPIFSKRESFLNMLGLSRALSGESITKYLNDIHIPIHGVWGEKDEITPIHHWEKMSSYYNNFSLIKIDNSGHSPVYEDPEEFADIFTQCTLKKTEQYDEAKKLQSIIRAANELQVVT